MPFFFSFSHSPRRDAENGDSDDEEQEVGEQDQEEE
jgi:hypothetical protein